MKKLRIVVGILVVACSPVSVAAASPIDLARTEWDFSGEVGKAARFLQFRSDGKVGGSTGCNRFAGTYSQDGFVVNIGTLATTRRACLPEAMKREQQFLALLSKVRRA
jgi:heat shock protein HslJ